RKPVEISLKQQAIDWIESEGGGIPSRAEPHFRQLGRSVIQQAVFKEYEVDCDLFTVLGST
ncbi:hypothetical protein L916_04585, partial [Phytophthora nicotianae]